MQTTYTARQNASTFAGTIRTQPATSARANRPARIAAPANQSRGLLRLVNALVRSLGALPV